MEDKKELSEILLGDNKHTSSGKKALLVVIVALVIVAAVAFLMWKLLASKDTHVAQQSEVVDTGIMKPADDFFSSDFGGLDDDKTTTVSNDFPLGLSQQSTPPSNKSTDIDSALSHIEGAMNGAQAPRAQSAQKPQPKSSPSKSAQKEAPKQANPANGSAPTKGFYWQVGSFAKDPNAAFLTLVKSYPYRIQHIVIDNRPNTRYLLGPYKSRGQAPSREEISSKFHLSPTPIEIP